jgi:hypothetical protein
LRAKCEACTTLNEVDEESDLDGKALMRGNGAAFKKPILNAAVFYLTAILE